MTITIERTRVEPLGTAARRQRNRTGAYRWAHERSDLTSTIYQDSMPGERGCETVYEAEMAEQRWQARRKAVQAGSLKPSKRHDFCWGASGLPGWGNVR